MQTCGTGSRSVGTMPCLGQEVLAAAGAGGRLGFKLSRAVGCSQPIRHKQRSCRRRLVQGQHAVHLWPHRSLCKRTLGILVMFSLRGIQGTSSLGMSHA